MCILSVEGHKMGDGNEVLLYQSIKLTYTLTIRYETISLKTETTVTPFIVLAALITLPGGALINVWKSKKVNKFHKNLKGLSRGTLSYFDHRQNYH